MQGNICQVINKIGCRVDQGSRDLTFGAIYICSYILKSCIAAEPGDTALGKVPITSQVTDKIWIGWVFGIDKIYTCIIAGCEGSAGEIQCHWRIIRGYSVISNGINETTRESCCKALLQLSRSCCNDHSGCRW